MNNRPGKIAHFGDTHVFFQKNFEAHKYVFNQIYNRLDNETPDLIVSVGDLIDSKLKLSPEQFDIARNFLLKLASYAPVIIILGNHDLNLANKERMDAITPIVNSLQGVTTHPVHFFKHSGVYDLYNIKWAVWSCLDDQKAPDIVSTIDDYVIGLYHGAVKGCISDNGFVLSEGIDIADFKDCNRVMMADIHKRQSFRNEEIWYPGSTLQTKVSEPEQGSYLLWEWDGANYNAEVRLVQNIYSTITEEIDNIEAIAPQDENQLIVVKYDTTKITKSEATKLKKELQAKFKNKIELKPAVKKKVKLTADAKASGLKVDLDNALIEYLDFLKLDEKDVNTILSLDEQYNRNLDISKDFESGDYSLLYMNIFNFLPFGPKVHTIDLNKEGIIGIGGKNRIGKSSLINAITFCIHNGSPDGNTSLRNLINKHNRKTESYVELFLSKNGKIYKIKRTIIPKKGNAVSTTLDFSEVDEAGNELNSLNGEKRQETEKEIQKYFGIESAFEILSLYSAQKKQQELINCKNAEKLKLVNRFIGLQSYEAKTDAAAQDVKVVKGVYESIQKEFNQSTDLTKLEANLLLLQTEELGYKENITDIQETEQIFEFKNRHLVSNYELLKKIANKTVANPEEVKEAIELIKTNISEREKCKLVSSQSALQFKIEKEKLALDFRTQFNEEINKYKINYKALSNESNELAVIKSDLQRLEKQLLIDNCSSCGQPITEENKAKLLEQKGSLEARKISLIVLISEFENKNEQIEKMQGEYSDIKDKIDQCEAEIRKVDLDIKNYNIKIENLLLKSKDWDEVQLAKEKLEIISKDYQRFLDHKKDAAKTLELLQNNLGAVKTKIKITQNEIDNYKTQYTKLKAKEEELRVLRLYKDIVSKDGLPLFILNSKIGEINEQVNLVVSQVFDFEVEFSVNQESGELNVDFFYENDEEKNSVGFASGAETFIINLCIKVGLSQISELPKLTSLIIDEGYGTLDPDSLDKIPALFSVLPEYYKNVITVSHIDTLKDLYQYEIKLDKKGKYTEVL